MNIGAKIIGKVRESLSEDNGNLSSMRILTALVVVVVLGNWTYINVTTGVLHGFDWQDLGVILGPLGAKTWQKGKEGGKADEVS